MSTLEQIENESRAYSNLTTEELQELSTEDLQARISRLLIQLEEAEDSKKAISSAYGSLIKKMRADIRAINREVRERPERDGLDHVITIDNVQALPGISLPA
jgi:phage host-nuclease inhibitor protein Gam